MFIPFSLVWPVFYRREITKVKQKKSNCKYALPCVPCRRWRQRLGKTLLSQIHNWKPPASHVGITNLPVTCVTQL